MTDRKPVRFARCYLCDQRVRSDGVYGQGWPSLFNLYCTPECRDAHQVEAALAKGNRT